MTRLDTSLPVAQTVEFLLHHLGRGRRRVLEVGCGDGAVAAALGSAGHEVVALDADPEMIARARARGVDARCVRWPEFGADGFQAVAFTRSLHHLTPLGESLQRAAAAVVPGGQLLIEDLAHETVDDATLRWFVQSLQRLDRDGLLQTDPALRANQMLRARDLPAAWDAGREHDLHAFATIEAAVEEVGTPTSRAGVPYFYRYVAEALVQGGDADLALGAFFADERQRAAAGKIVWLGRRLVVRTPSER